MSNNLDYGRRISIGDANKIVMHHDFLDRHVERVIKGDVSDKLKEQLKKFNDRDFNAFVFDLDLIEKFIKEGKDKKAKFLTVLLGAHPEGLTEEVEMTRAQRSAFGNGSFTVVLTLCEKVDDNSSIEAVNMKDPAMEYPPKKAVLQLIQDQSREKSSTIDTLRVKFMP